MSDYGERAIGALGPTLAGRLHPIRARVSGQKVGGFIGNPRYLPSDSRLSSDSLYFFCILSH